MISIGQNPFDLCELKETRDDYPQVGLADRGPATKACAFASASAAVLPTMYGALNAWRLVGRSVDGARHILPFSCRRRRRGSSFLVRLSKLL